MRGWALRTLGGLLVLLGAWAGIVAYVGPLLGLHVPADPGTRQLSTGDLELNLAPGIAVILGGALLLVHRHRGVAAFGGLLALLGGAWLIVGPSVATLWPVMSAPTAGNSAVAGQDARLLLAYHYGSGTLVVALAAGALGGLVARTRRVLSEAVDGERVEDSGLAPVASRA